MIGRKFWPISSLYLSCYWGSFFLRFFFCWSFGTHLMVSPLSARILMLAALASRTTSFTYRIKFCALWTNISWAWAASSSDTSLASKILANLSVAWSHVGTKMKHSQIGRFPSDRRRNDPHYPIGSHDGLLESRCLEQIWNYFSDVVQWFTFPTSHHVTQ